MEPLTIIITIIKGGFSIKSIKSNAERKKMINELLHLQKEQLAQLNALSKQVETLQKGPFFTGILCLEDASAQSRTYTEEKEHLNKAVDEFRRALGISLAKEEANVEEQAYIQMFLAFTWLLLGSKNDARKYFLDAQKNYQRIYFSLQEQLQEINLFIKHPDIYAAKNENFYTNMGIKMLDSQTFGLASLIWDLFTDTTSQNIENLLSYQTAVEEEQQKIQQYLDFLEEVLYELPNINMKSPSNDALNGLKKITKNALSYSTNVVDSVKETITDEKVKNTVTGLFKRASKNNDEQRS